MAMKKTKKERIEAAGWRIGTTAEFLGLSKEEAAFCVKDSEGKVLAAGKVATDPAALFGALKEYCLCPARIVMSSVASSILV